MESDDSVTDRPHADRPADLDETLDWSGRPPTDEELEQWRPFVEFLDQALRHPVDVTPRIESGSLSESGSRPGPRMIGPFQIVRVLGKGGNGIVYLADDPLLGRQVALKVPRDSLFMTDEARARFMQEAKIIAELRNSNIVEIHQVGSFEECPYLVFEYCPGGSLQDWMDQRAAVEKGSGTDCAKHPQGHSGNRYLTRMALP